MTSALLKTTAALTACQLLAGHASALTPFSDNFNAAKLNTSRWLVKNSGNGKLLQSAGRLNFTVAKPPADGDGATIELRNNQPGFNENWQIIVDVTNMLNAGEAAGPGIFLFNAADRRDGLVLEFYGSKGGFNVFGFTDDRDNPAGDILRNPGVNVGSMRISFNKTTKLLTCWYDKSGSKNGFQWVKIATFSPTGKGGDRRGNWNMNPGSGRFGIQLFGYAETKSVATGKITMDNFALKAAK